MSVAAPALSLADVEEIVLRTDPALVLVSPRILRRVIKQDRGISSIGMQVPHYKSYVIGRDALLRIAGRDELGLPPGRELPETVVLLPRPYGAWLRSRGPEAILLAAWRFLFHCRVHAALQARNLDQAAVVDRVRRLGTAQFNEVRAVLGQENFLLPPADGRTVYEEFAAVYLELRYFERRLLPRYFPAITDFDGVDHLLAEDVDADDLFARTRPEGAPPPEAAPEDRAREEEPPAEDGQAAPPEDGRAVRRAERAAAHGNEVRAARMFVRAGRRGEALDALNRLTARLRRALHVSEAEEAQWRAALTTLLGPAAEGIWPPEARLLYDLQKVCIDAEKDVYALDLVEWAVTWGQRPVKRLLPHQPLVLTVKHLRGALDRLTAARMPEDARRLLRRLLADALHHAEKRVRDRFRPLVRGALDDVDLKPSSYAERLGRDTVVEELLDRAIDRGFLTMSDLRDALARNRLKLADVANPGEVLFGDKLIRANRKLAVALDGVYRRGEIYMRWLQRLSSVFFGTRVGRFLVLYLIVPLALAGFTVKGPRLMWDEVRHLGRSALRLVGALPPAPEHDEQHPGQKGGLHLDQSDVAPITAAYLFYLGVLHVPPFRRLVGRVLHAAGRAVWFVLYDLPTGFLDLPPVRRTLQSRAYQILYQFLLKPAFVAGTLPLVLWLAGAGPGLVWGGAGLAFGLAVLLLNSRAGLYAEEALTDALVRGWLLLKDDILPGLFRRVMGFFKWMLEGLDRVIYTVDEWLRFRPGDSRLALYVKPVVGLVWFVVTYVVRFAVNLLIEPQINPIKHFPVVTVSHKLLLPMVPTIAGAIGWSFKETLTVVSLIPGIFGFLVWELKENWKLYRVNQSDELDPVTIGSHGETMLRLMRPGFHSGTLPKLYAKLRRAERRRQDTKARRRREELHHVEEAVRHFAERGLVATLAGSRALAAGRTLFVGPVHAATNRILVEINSTMPVDLSEGSATAVMRRLAPESLEIAFEVQSGWLVSGITRPGWLTGLTREERLALADALAGFYKLAGVDLVCEQTAAVLPPGATWSMSAGQLAVWADGRVTRYNPSDEVALAWDRLRFDRMPLRWVDWVGAWERDQDGKAHEPPLLPEVRLLP
jgi:hypothetical protein